MDGTRLEGGGRLLSEETVARALTSYGGDEDGRYGHHWEIEGTDPLVFGHGGFDGTLALTVPEEDLIVIYFTQSRGSGTLDEWKEALRGLWEDTGEGASRTNDRLPESMAEAHDLLYLLQVRPEPGVEYLAFPPVRVVDDDRAPPR